MGRLPFNSDSLQLVFRGNEGNLSQERFSPDWLRERFASPPEWKAELRSDNQFPTAFNPPLPASVLLPIVMREDGLYMIFTRRADHLRHHPGQISFPGGQQKDSDSSLTETALRETEEEIGLDRNLVEVIGELPDYVTASGFRVVPIVSLVKPDFRLTVNPREVAEVFEVPFSFLMTGENFQRLTADFPNGLGRRAFFAIPYKNFFIWGATAGMLRNLFHFLRA